jgi:hypothetical protein
MVVGEPIDPKVAVVVARSGPPGVEGRLQAGAGHVHDTPERGAGRRRDDGGGRGRSSAPRPLVGGSLRRALHRRPHAATGTSMVDGGWDVGDLFDGELDLFDQELDPFDSFALDHGAPPARTVPRCGDHVSYDIRGWPHPNVMRGTIELIDSSIDEQISTR